MRNRWDLLADYRPVGRSSKPIKIPDQMAIKPPRCDIGRQLVQAGPLTFFDAHHVLVHPAHSQLVALVG